MIPIRQTIFGGYTEGQIEPVGNCFQACIASLLDLPLDEVPHFVDEDVRRKAGNAFLRLCAWLRPRGLTWVELDVRGEREPAFHDFAGTCVYVASGPAERGLNHSVLMLGGELVHDPHPSDAGLLAVEWVGLPVWIGGSR